MIRNLRHRLEYALVASVRAVVSVLPGPFARGLGSTIGLFFYVSDPAHRRRAVRQLQAAFPVRTPAECRAIARATFAHFGRALVTVLRFSTASPKTMRSLIEVEGGERIRAALAAGRGYILVTGHFGYWEIQGVTHALFFEPMSVVARPLDNPYLHRLLERTRRVSGNAVIYRRGALRRVLRALNANQGVAILIDQHIQTADAVNVEFFNRPAATTSAVAILALRTGTPLIPCVALPLPGGRVRLVYEHPVPPPPADCDDPVRELTQRCTDVLEMYVRRHPQLWLWMHRRWRDTGESDGDARGMFPSAAPDEGRPLDS